MQTALDFAGIIFAATFIFGVGLVVWILWRQISKPRSVPSLPHTRQVPSRAVQELESTLEKVRRSTARADSRARETLLAEERRLEHRLRKLEDQTRIEQDPYYEAAKQRETAWKKWKLLHDQVVGIKREPLTQELRELKNLEKEYQFLNRMVEDEWHSAIARDLLNLEELRGQGVLTPDLETAQASVSQPESTPNQEADPVPATPAAIGSDRTDESPDSIPEETGQMSRADFEDPLLDKTGKVYGEPTLDLSFAQGGILRKQDFRGSDFHGVRFMGLHLYQDCGFQDTDLRGIRMTQQEKPHQFVQCDFTGADLSGSRLEYVLFSNCDLSRTEWQEAVLNRVKFVNCGIEGTRWEGLDLSQTVMSPEMLDQADFSDAEAPPRNYGQESAQVHPEPGTSEENESEPVGMERPSPSPDSDPAENSPPPPPEEKASAKRDAPGAISLPEGNTPGQEEEPG